MLTGQKFHHYLKALTQSNTESMKILVANKIPAPVAIEGFSEISGFVSKGQGGKLKSLFRSQFAIYLAFQFIKSIREQKTFTESEYEQIDFDYNRNKSMFSNLELDSIEELKYLLKLCDTYYKIAKIKTNLDKNSSELIALQKECQTNKKLRNNTTLTEDLKTLEIKSPPPNILKEPIIGIIILATGITLTTIPILTSFIIKRLSADTTPLFCTTILNNIETIVGIGIGISIATAVITTIALYLANQGESQRIN